MHRSRGPLPYRIRCAPSDRSPRAQARGRGRAVRAIVAALALAACAATPEAQPAEPEPSWRVDASGRRFVVRPLEKRLARRDDAGHVRTTWGVLLDLDGEDEEHWYYRRYATSPGPAAEAPVAEASADAEAEPPALRASVALRFEPAGAGLPQRGQWRDGFDLADLDGDGHLDLAHGPARKGRPAPALFLGDGRGGFRPWREAALPALPYDYGDVRAGDLDGDGALDLVLASHLRGIVALRGDGRGGFARAGNGLEFAERGAAAFSSRAIRLVDFDGDGRLDLLALGEGPRLGPSAAGARDAAPGGRTLVAGATGLVLQRGRGDGGFAPGEPGSEVPPVFGRALAVADFDGDGQLDAATASSQLGRRDLVQLGSPGGARRPLLVEAIRARAYVLAVAAGDFDRNGRADLALGYAAAAGDGWRSGVDVLFSESEGRWRRLPLAAVADRLGPQALAAGDLDGDGALDLVALDGRGALAAFRGDGRGGFAREERPPPPFAGGCRGAHVAIGDLDGDGRGDVLASFAQEGVAGADPDACPSEGGLAAWRSLPAR